jgi:hypothetical protein
VSSVIEQFAALFTAAPEPRLFPADVAALPAQGPVTGRRSVKSEDLIFAFQERPRSIVEVEIALDDGTQFQIFVTRLNVDTNSEDAAALGADERLVVEAAEPTAEPGQTRLVSSVAKSPRPGQPHDPKRRRGDSGSKDQRVVGPRRGGTAPA